MSLMSLRVACRNGKHPAIISVRAKMERQGDFMLKKTEIVILICAALLAVCVTGCGMPNDAPQAADDEILLVIRLDLKEDIGLLVIDHEVGGEQGSGGVSNADKSKIKRDETLYWTVDKQFYEGSSDTVDLTLRFTVVTEYCAPNYDNIYPEEYMMQTEEVSFTADFGKTYSLTITGDKLNGYQAALSDSE